MLARFVCCITLGFLGLPYVLQGLCALAGFVCHATLGSLSPHLFGATVHELLTGWEVQLSLFTALQVPALPGFSKTLQLPLGPACEGVSLCTGTPVLGRSPSLGAQVPAQKFSVFPLFMSPSFLLPHFGELNLSPWRPGVFCCYLEFVLCRSCSISSWVLDVSGGRLVISPPYSSTIFFCLQVSAFLTSFQVTPMQLVRTPSWSRKTIKNHSINSAISTSQFYKSTYIHCLRRHGHMWLQYLWLHTELCTPGAGV